MSNATRKVAPEQAPPPLSLYIHLPWCVRKCPYCDFNSHAVRDAVPEQAYIDSLLQDLEFALPDIWGRRVISIFIGGGTPSLFSGDAITRLLQGVRARLNLIPGCEITLEANPGASDAERFATYHQAGVNRLSIGVQSFHDDMLSALGRIHNSDDAHAAVEAAMTAGFNNINLDLMFGLPGQSLEQAVRDIDFATSYKQSHLSLYQLTIEPNTAFASAPPDTPDEDTLWDMQLALQPLLQQQGYLNYEVSAYAREEKRCQHNLNYWQFGDYLGIGAGAHSKITNHEHVMRYARRKHPRDYMNLAGSSDCLSEQKQLDDADLKFEFMLNALRLVDGINVDLFEQHTRLPLSSVQDRIDEAVEKNWLTVSNNVIRPTETGRKYLNDVISLFLP